MKSWIASSGSVDGLHDLKDLFQPQQFCDSMTALSSDKGEKMTKRNKKTLVRFEYCSLSLQEALPKSQLLAAEPTNLCLCLPRICLSWMVGL